MQGKPGPKGPSQELIQAIAALKHRNPRFGCRRIAQQIAKTFGVELDKDTVRRVLAKHGRPGAGDDGPSWLTFIGHAKDSLWSMDLFRCESIVLKTHWVLVVMDQWSRRITGFAVQAGDVDGIALCRMFNTAIAGQGIPHHLSSDNDPLFRYHRWRANLRILGIEEIKSIPYTPRSHPFVERLIGTIRREYLDHTLFWNAQDLNESSRTSNIITPGQNPSITGRGIPRLALATPSNLCVQHSVTIRGYHTVMGHFKRPFPLELGIRHTQVAW